MGAAHTDTLLSVNKHIINGNVLFQWGQYAHPIFSSNGDFPQEVKKNVRVKSAEQGFARSRLPILSHEDVVTIRGSSDFFGMNTYTTKLAYRDASLEGMYPVPSYMDDMGAVFVKDTMWPQAVSSWLQVRLIIYLCGGFLDRRVQGRFFSIVTKCSFHFNKV